MVVGCQHVDLGNFIDQLNCGLKEGEEVQAFALFKDMLYVYCLLSSLGDKHCMPGN